MYLRVVHTMDGENALLHISKIEPPMIQNVAHLCTCPKHIPQAPLLPLLLLSPLPLSNDVTQAEACLTLAPLKRDLDWKP